MTGSGWGMITGSGWVTMIGAGCSTTVGVDVASIAPTVPVVEFVRLAVVPPYVLTELPWPYML